MASQPTMESTSDWGLENLQPCGRTLRENMMRRIYSPLFAMVTDLFLRSGVEALLFGGAAYGAAVNTTDFDIIADATPVDLFRTLTDEPFLRCLSQLMEAAGAQSPLSRLKSDKLALKLDPADDTPAATLDAMSISIERSHYGQRCAVYLIHTPDRNCGSRPYATRCLLIGCLTPQGDPWVIADLVPNGPAPLNVTCRSYFERSRRAAQRPYPYYEGRQLLVMLDPEQTALMISVVLKSALEKLQVLIDSGLSCRMGPAHPLFKRLIEPALIVLGKLRSLYDRAGLPFDSEVLSLLVSHERSIIAAEEQRAAQVLAAQVAEEQHAAQVLAAQVAEEQRAAQVLAAQVLAEKQRAAQVFAAQVAKEQRAAQVLAEKQRAAQVLAEKQRAAQVLAEKQRAAQVLAEKQRAAQVLAEEQRAAQVLAEEKRLALAAQLAKKEAERQRAEEKRIAAAARRAKQRAEEAQRAEERRVVAAALLAKKRAEEEQQRAEEERAAAAQLAKQLAKQQAAEEERAARLAKKRAEEERAAQLAKKRADVKSQIARSPKGTQALVPVIGEEVLEKVLNKTSGSLLEAIHKLDQLGSLAGESHTPPEEHASKMAFVCLSTSATIEEALLNLIRTTKHNASRCAEIRTLLDVAGIEMRDNDLPELQWFIRTQWFRLLQAGTEALFRSSHCFAKILFNGRHSHQLMTEREVRGMCQLAAPLIAVLEEICGTLAGVAPPPIIEPEPEQMNSMALPLIQRLAADWCADVGKLQDRITGFFALEQRIIAARTLEQLEALGRNVVEEQRRLSEANTTPTRVNRAFRSYSAACYTMRGLPECDNKTLGAFVVDFAKVWRQVPGAASAGAIWHPRQFAKAQLCGMAVQTSTAMSAATSAAMSAAMSAATSTVAYVVDGLVVYDHDLEERIGAALESLAQMTTRQWFSNPQPRISVHTLTGDDDALRILLSMGFSSSAASEFMRAATPSAGEKEDY